MAPEVSMMTLEHWCQSRSWSFCGLAGLDRGLAVNSSFPAAWIMVIGKSLPVNTVDCCADLASASHSLLAVLSTGKAIDGASGADSAWSIPPSFRLTFPEVATGYD